MEKLKQMLEAIHRENKDILTVLLCTEDEECEIKEVSKEIDKMYDELFYGKENVDARIKD